MRSKVAPEDSLEPTCHLEFFDCFSPRKEEANVEDEDLAPGVEREMRVMYQQPHLVPPMKLTVFDGLPPTPTRALQSQLSQWVSSGKASIRSSLSMRRHTSKPAISEPHPPLPLSQPLPFRRAAPLYRPLELSIYMASNRLSDLPAFDRLSFTAVGEIKLPPRALVRTKSEEFIPHKISMMPAPVKPASMIERRRLSLQADTSSVIIPASRPPSEYDALHSHPVSWGSLPGLPPQMHFPGVRSEASVAILSPMQEEFCPTPASIAIGDTLLNFPQDNDTLVGDEHVLDNTSAPAPTVPSADSNSNNSSTPADMNPPAGYFHPNYQTQKRISQWLEHRTSSSISTTKSSSTSSSFAEHQRKRSHFYQLSAPAVPPPKALSLWPQQHKRTMTESTVASTIDTDILSYANQSQTDATSETTCAENPQSRSATIRSVLKSGLRPIVSGVPDVPPCYADIVNGKGEVLIKEIGGALRSPGVGMAF